MRMPPKSEWYVHEFRDKDTKLLHSVATTRRNYRRGEGARALCGARLDNAWPRPPGSHSVERCVSCMADIAGLDDLLREDYQ